MIFLAVSGFEINRTNSLFDSRCDLPRAECWVNYGIKLGKKPLSAIYPRKRACTFCKSPTPIMLANMLDPP